MRDSAYIYLKHNLSHFKIETLVKIFKLHQGRLYLIHTSDVY